jgi:dihydropteroate synthase
MPGEMLKGLPQQPRTLIMGVVNVTPDSFSDGGSWPEPAAAARRGRELAAAGADIVDVGGESTRPGAHRVSEQEELRRVLPAVAGLAAAGVCVSIDTMRAAVARQALAAGAAMVNAVSGGLADPEMIGTVAAAGVPYVITHWRGHSDDMYARAAYRDVVAEVRAELGDRVRAAIAGGVEASQVIVDPGLGFAKRPEHNWALLGRLPEVACLPGGGPPYPVLVAASRKRFIGLLLAGGDGTPRPFLESDDATIALTALAAGGDAWCVRVHSVRGSADAVRVTARWREAGGRAGPVGPGSGSSGLGSSGLGSSGLGSSGLGWPG